MNTPEIKNDKCVSCQKEILPAQGYTQLLCGGYLCHNPECTEKHAVKCPICARAFATEK